MTYAIKQLFNIQWICLWSLMKFPTFIKNFFSTKPWHYFWTWDTKKKKILFQNCIQSLQPLSRIHRQHVCSRETTSLWYCLPIFSRSNRNKRCLNRQNNPHRKTRLNTLHGKQWANMNSTHCWIHRMALERKPNSKVVLLAVNNNVVLQS